LKIAIVNQPWNHVPPTTGGSIAIWTWEVARRLSRRPEVEAVYVYARRNPGQSAYEEIDGVRCVRIPIANDLRVLKAFRILSRRFGIARHSFNSPLYFRGYVTKVAQDLKERSADIIHLHNFSQHVPIIRRQNPDSTVILHMHCEWLSQLDRSTIARRLAKTDGVFGCSGYITNKIRDRFPDVAAKCHAVFNGVNTDVFNGASPDREDSLEPSRPHRLIFVGRITPEKALHQLVEAVASVADRVPDVSLDIVGPDAETPKEFIVDLSDDQRIKSLAVWYDGNYYEKVKAMAESRLGDRVRFVGLVKPDDLPEYYRGADVLLNPSLSESFGMSLVEAMACGTPVIATRIGGMPEIVDHGRTGLVVEPDNPVGLADAISGLLVDEPLRQTMRVACRERAVDVFSWDRIAETIFERYRVATEGRN
jgi:glycosyltransferase involved in cell wall biosynthesis